MAPRESFCIERSTFNERYICGWYGVEKATEGMYLKEDDKGRTIKDLTVEEGKGMWHDAPMGLRTTVDVDFPVKDVINIIKLPVDAIG